MQLIEQVTEDHMVAAFSQAEDRFCRSYPGAARGRGPRHFERAWGIRARGCWPRWHRVDRPSVHWAFDVEADHRLRSQARGAVHLKEIQGIPRRFERCGSGLPQACGAFWQHQRPQSPFPWLAGSSHWPVTVKGGRSRSGSCILPWTEDCQVVIPSHYFNPSNPTRIGGSNRKGDRLDIPGA